MANVLVEETSLSNIASAIRGKNGSTTVYKPGEMAAAITNLPTGGSSGGNEDGLLADTVVNYENTTATKIKQGCFKDSTKLATATFTNVSNVGSQAFSNCSELTQVSLPNATVIGNSCFQSSSRLSTVNLTNVNTLADYAFLYCSSLTSINLPRVEVLKLGIFQGCTKLAKADLGSCKEFYQWSQFHNCEHLTSLILRSNTVCSSSSSLVNSDYGVLSNTPITNTSLGQGYVYVPRALVNEYKEATNWAVIADRFRAIEDYPEITGG